MEVFRFIKFKCKDFMYAVVEFIYTIKSETFLNIACSLPNRYELCESYSKSG